MERKEKVLHLTLKKKWFDMIASGEKKEEYREIKPYWITRLGFWQYPDRETGYGMRVFREFDVVRFKNGYAKDSPAIDLELDYIDISTGNPEWGAEPGKEYFVIKLGEIIKTP